MSTSGSDTPPIRLTEEMVRHALPGDDDDVHPDERDPDYDSDDNADSDNTNDMPRDMDDALRIRAIQEQLRGHNVEIEIVEEDEDDEDDDYEDMDEDDQLHFFADDPTADDDFDEDEYMDEDEEEEGEDEDEEEDEDDDNIEDVEIGEDASAAMALRELTALFNNAQSAEARNALLARLLETPNQAAGDAPGTFGFLRRLSRGPVATPAERARAEAARRKRERWWTPQLEPHPAGLELMRSGEFGGVRGWTGVGKGRAATRRCLVRGRHHQWTPPISRATIPNTHGTVVAAYPSIPYVGQYGGEDYGLFYSATQDFDLHLYSTKEAGRITKSTSRRSRAQGQAQDRPGGAGAFQEDDDDEDDGMPWGNWGSARSRRVAPQEESSMKKIKTVQGEPGRWTVTDCDADRKAEKMIYSSITPYVHMLRTAEDDEEHVCLDFSETDRRRGSDYDNFGIWSIRFSADGKEVVAGGSKGRIMVYDIEAERRSLAVRGHVDDVNAVCFADESATNILVSGSDDGFVKVWDRRSLSSSTPSGVLVGATEGITYTAPKGDGRYVVVNSKDQAARLYDLRQMRSWSEFDFASERDAAQKYGQPQYDYRDSRYPPPRRLAHPKDSSVMTFRGHQVLQTLIRCHFSPRESTGQSYIYSGSADGMIHIWSLDGRVIQVLNRSESTSLRDTSGDYNDPTDPDPTNLPQPRQRRSQTGMYGQDLSFCVRDVAWHGYEPTLMSTCWQMDGRYRRGGTLAKHEWKGLGKGGMRNLEDWIEKTKAEMAENA